MFQVSQAQYTAEIDLVSKFQAQYPVIASVMLPGIVYAACLGKVGSKCVARQVGRRPPWRGRKSEVVRKLAQTWVLIWIWTGSTCDVFCHNVSVELQSPAMVAPMLVKHGARRRPLQNEMPNDPRSELIRHHAGTGPGLFSGCSPKLAKIRPDSSGTAPLQGPNLAKLWPKRVGLSRNWSTLGHPWSKL